MLYVGDDWAEAHHDVHLMDKKGNRLAQRRLPEGLDGMRAFHELLAGHADEPEEVVIGIETDRGLWVDALAAAGYQVYAINPLAVSRYRDRHNVGGASPTPGSLVVTGDGRDVTSAAGTHLLGRFAGRLGIAGGASSVLADTVTRLGARPGTDSDAGRHDDRGGRQVSVGSQDVAGPAAAVR